MIRKRIIGFITIITALAIILTPLQAAAVERQTAEPSPVGATAEIAPTATEGGDNQLPVIAPERETVAPTEAPAAVDYPVVMKIENLADGVKITWNAYGSGNSYRVYYRKAKADTGAWNSKYSGTSWKRIADVKGTTYTHKGPVDGELGIYTVRCVNSKGSFTSDYNHDGWENRYYAVPVIASLKNTVNGIKISWKRAKYAENYAVYRKDGTSWKRLTATAASDYTDTAVTSNKKYTYTLRMIKADNKTFMSAHNSGKSLTFVAPAVIKSATNTKAGVKLSWDKVAGATAYRLVYRSGTKWTQIVQTKNNTYTDTAVKDAQAKEYNLVCLNANMKAVSDMHPNGYTNTYYKPPVIQSLSSAAGGVKLTWTRPKGAQDYRVYRKNGSSWTRIAQVNAAEYLDTDVVSGKTYTYTIRMVNPENNTFMSDYLDGKSVYYVAAPTAKCFEDLVSGVKLSWDKCAGASYYCVYYKNGGSWTRIGKVTGTSFTDTGVKEGQTRKYTLRCMDKNEKFVSDFYRDGFDHTHSLAPVMESVTYDEGHYTLRWTAIPGVASYRMYRKGAEDKDWTKIAEQYEGNEFTDESLQENRICAYTLRAQDENGKLLGGFISNPFYYNGEIINGTVEQDGVIYHYRNGEVFTGYCHDGDELYYYQNSIRVNQDWYRQNAFTRTYTRAHWLYDLMAYTGEAPTVDITDDAAVFALSMERGLIEDCTEDDYGIPVDRLFVAHTMVKALNYPQRGVGEIADTDDADLSTLAYYGYFIPDGMNMLYPEAAVTDEEFDILISELKLYQQLKGKTLVVFGDSIMEGQGNIVNGKNETIAAIVGTKYGMNYASYSVSGAVMGKVDGKSHIADQVRRAANAGQKADLILFNGGTNDTWQPSVSLGEISDGYDMSSSTEANYSDGYEKAVWLMKQTWGDIPKIYVRSHQMYLGSYTAQQDYGSRALELAEKWSVAGVNLFDVQDQDEAIIDDVQRYSYDSDGQNRGIHPNALGYAKYYLSPLGGCIARAFGEE